MDAPDHPGLPTLVNSPARATSLGYAKSNESLPDMIRKKFDLAEVTRILQKVLQHYEVGTAFLALQSPSGMHLKGRHGIDMRFVAHPSICHHGIQRSLPIIIYDAARDSRFEKDPLVIGPPHARFYTGVPLMLSQTRCVGTVCIMDPKPRTYFSIDECVPLVEASQQILQLANGEVDRLYSLTMDSLGSFTDGMRTPSGSGEDNTDEGRASPISRTLESLPQTRTMEILEGLTEDEAENDEVEADDHPKAKQPGKAGCARPDGAPLQGELESEDSGSASTGKARSVKWSDTSAEAHQKAASSGQNNNLARPLD